MGLWLLLLLLLLLSLLFYFIYYFFNSLTGLLDRLKKIKDIDLEKLKDLMARNPHLEERLRGGGGGGEAGGEKRDHEAIRSQLEEARRLGIEKMRDLQRYTLSHDHWT